MRRRLNDGISRYARAALLGVVLVAGLAGVARRAQAEIIYQAFDERFVAVQGKLDHLRDLGYSIVQVSPPAKSIDLPIWWARYQPVDLRTIEGPLGNENDLRQLMTAAHARGLRVIVDTVLNHMADVRYVGGQLQYPEFSANDFHYPDTRLCIQNFNDRYQVTHSWLCDQNAHLPDLNTSSDYVRGIHKRYLKKLMDLGADGFRFDAAKHIEPEYWADVMRTVPSDKFAYGEVIASSPAEAALYTPYMGVTDFLLLRAMIGAFSPNGDMRALAFPESSGAMAGDASIVFARNHDTAMHADFFNFGDNQDAMLANAFVIGRGLGHASVYRDDVDNVDVVSAIKFRRALVGQGPYVRKAAEICESEQVCDPRNLLFMERGDKGFMIINKSGLWVDSPTARIPGLAPGCYHEVRTGFPMRLTRASDGQKWISAWGDTHRAGFTIGPRTALYLVAAADGACP